MAVTKTPLLNNGGTSIDAFDQAVALIAERISDKDQSQFWADRMSTIALGLVKPSKQQFDAIRLMFDKKVPDAPKDINLHENKKVEVVFKNFLEENPMNFGNALMEASKNTLRELAITEVIEEP